MVTKEYYQKNKEKIKSETKEWRKNNPEKVKEQKKRYKIKHPEKVRERKRRDKKKHPERQKKYRVKFQEKFKARGIAGHKIKIPKTQLCETCEKNLATERHHPDYSKPLQIIFVCNPCHNMIHGGVGRIEVMNKLEKLLEKLGLEK